MKEVDLHQALWVCSKYLMHVTCFIMIIFIIIIIIAPGAWSASMGEYTNVNRQRPFWFKWGRHWGGGGETSREHSLKTTNSKKRIRSEDPHSISVIGDLEWVTLPLCSCVHICKYLVMNLMVCEVPYINSSKSSWVYKKYTKWVRLCVIQVVSFGAYFPAHITLQTSSLSAVATHS